MTLAAAGLVCGVHSKPEGGVSSCYPPRLLQLRADISETIEVI